MSVTEDQPLATHRESQVPPVPGPLPPPTEPPPAPRRLTRSRRDRVLGGVCGGLAEYLAVDPLLVRLVAVLAVLSGPGVLVYLIAWVVIPEGDVTSEDDSAAPLEARPRRNAAALFGALIVLVGTLALLDRLDWFVPAAVLWPLALIAIGAAFIVGQVGHRPGSSPPDTTGPVAPPVDTAPDSVPPLARPGEMVARPLPAPAPPAPARGSLGPIAWGVILAFGGLAWLIDRVGWVEVDSDAWFAIALVLVGVIMAVGAHWARVGGAWVLAALLGLGLVVSLAVPVPLRGGIGDRTERPVGASELDDSYRLGVGTLTLDLTAVDVSGLDPTEPTVVEASVGMGELVVILPAGVSAEVRARAGIGDAVLRNRSVDGIGIDRTTRYGPDSGADPLLDLDLRVGLGSIKVRSS